MCVPKSVSSMAVSLEEVSSSLVREYLSRKGLKRTIACMDEEHPRTEASINNRSHLRQILNIETLYRENKIHSSPLKTLLEIIVKHHIAGSNNERIPCCGCDPLQPASAASSTASPALTSLSKNDTKMDGNPADTVFSKHIKLRSGINETPSSQSTLTPSLPEPQSAMSNYQTGLWTLDSEEHKDHPLSSPTQDSESITGRESEKKTLESIQRGKTQRLRRGMMAGPIASTTQESNKKKPSRRAEAPQLLLRKQEEHRPSMDGLSVPGPHRRGIESGLAAETRSADSSGARLEFWSAPQRAPSENSFVKLGQASVNTREVKSTSDEANLDELKMALDDIDDDLRTLSKVSFQRASREHSHVSRPMDQHTATELKAVLLGSSVNSFSVEWKNQGFTFSETHDLRYGIVQKKGGPCGVLASVQAFVLKKLLFESSESSNTGLQGLTPSSNTRRKCLVLAIAEILWRAGEEKQAAVALNSGRNHFTPTGHYKSEGLLEKITIFCVDNIQALQLFLEQYIEQFETGVLGCILLTISAVLSRSVEKVKEDMDVPTTTLIGAHGYCTQELVNLLLCGRAVSNIFDNDMELDSGNGNMTLLKGMKSRCDVGLLSLFEHYNICKVGAYMKTPHYPIWVVCSESHFSVLFGLQRELLTNPDQNMEFDLYYYDGLANQQEEIRLTISLGKSAVGSQETDLIPPLENCIRTRWKHAFVSWNDTEPIL